MRKPLSKAMLTGYLVAAVAVGTLFVSSAAARAQTTAPKKATSSSKSATASKSETTSKPASGTHHSSSGHSTSSSAKGSATAKSTSSKSGKSSTKKTTKTKKVKGQAVPAPERITEIQDELAKRGAFIGTSSGKFDDSTSEALRKFQANNHLNPTGKIDALTLQKLGLGSETAGLAAPTPPPNSTANRLLSHPAHPDPDDNN
jgi:peptidoglycan hydrolase-like protein with peptidoglycan-binding domain